MTWHLLRSSGKLSGRRPARQRSGLVLRELEPRLAPAVTSVLQYHNDLPSTGQNLTETALTTGNVNSSSFGKLFSTAVDAQVYAQPLFLGGVSIAGGTHNVVFAATQRDTVYAIDADSGAILWQKNYLQTGERTLTTSDVGTTDITPQIGITGTPVIDPASGTIYFVTKATTSPAGTNASRANTVQRLHAVDIATGNEKFGGPVVIAASVNGTGAGNDGAGHVPFDSLRENQRMGLVLTGGVVYITWASHGDNGPYHGWVIGYNASTLQQTAAFNDTPNGSNGGIWESGGAVSVDPAGNFYLTTGNGTFETTLDGTGMPNQHDFGDSVLKLALDPSTSPTNQNGNGWGLKVVDYFTPFNQATLNANDTDLGSGGALILPDSAGSTAHPHLLVTGGKEGKLYLLDRDNMGHFDPNTDHVVQEVSGALHAQLGNPAYFNGNIYYATPGFGTDNAKEFSVANAALSASPVSTSADTFTWRGGTTSVSANGTGNGIVWALDGGSNQLRAYSAANLGTELYTSAQAANNRDQLGTVVKFTVPTVTNGHVYVGVSGAVVGYGLLAQTLAAPTNPHPTLVTTTGVDLGWVNHAANATSVKVIRQQGTNPPVTVATLANSVNSFFDTGLSPGTRYTYTVQAVNASGSSSAPAFTVSTSASAASGFSAHVNFSNNQTQVPAGYVNDTGAAYGAHGSLTYGWLASGTPTDNSANARDRDSAISPDELHDSLNHLQKPANPNAAWQIAVPNGTYLVHILTGDPTATDSVYSLNADGVNVVTATPNSLNLWADATKTVTVTNGLITVTSAAGASNNKIDAIDILPAPPATQVLAIDAGGGAVGSFAADTDFSGGAARSTADAINTSGAANPAPAVVYQSQRFGNFTYTLPGLTAGGAYTVRLHFAEFVQNGPGLRTFSVAINGTTVLSNFDVFQTAGGFEKALTETFTATADSTGKITAVFTNGNNNAILNGIEVLSNGVNFASFAGAAGLALNGSATVNGNNLQLTDGGMNEAGSAFTVTPVSAARFTTSFGFQLINPSADGFAFVLQGVSPTALGGTGGGLGYAPDPGTGLGGAIGNSVAVKFDLFNNAGEGVDSTGLYTNGAEPTTPATDLSGAGIDLHSGHVFNVTMSYDGTTLTVKITDATTGASATQSYAVNIPQAIGGGLAYAGFTGGTGGQTATEDITNWVFTPL
jgi:hypothetical protein